VHYHFTSLSAVTLVSLDTLDVVGKDQDSGYESEQRDDVEAQTKAQGSAIER
jgi:hypothetical protein